VSSARWLWFGQPVVTLELVQLQSFAALAYGTQSVPRVDKIGQISDRHLARPRIDNLSSIVPTSTAATFNRDAEREQGLPELRMNASALRAYRFGQFRVDLLRQQLTGADGTVAGLSARAYDVLIYLVENRDRVVSKNELMKAVWPRSVVEENNLNQAVTILRRALGDRRDSPQFVRTIAGRGYRFVGDVSEEAAESEPGAPIHPPPAAIPTNPVAARQEPPPHAVALQELAPPPSSLAGVRIEPDTRRRHLLLGLGLATVAAGGTAWWLASRREAQRSARLRSLAVLPFRPLVEESGDPAMEFGMADTLITRLSSLPGLVVRPFSAVRNYTATDQDPLQAGRDLRADSVLEGHILMRENRVRVSARLLDVASGAALWSGSFEEPLDQFFSAQDALAGQVVAALQIQMTDRDRRQLLDHPTNNVRAWQLYINARYHWERKTAESFRRAVEYYEAAEKLDPGFALAAVGQADSWAVLGVYNVMPPADAFARASAAGERALRLAPDLPEAVATMGHIMVQGRRDWRGGERMYRRALDTKPDYAQCRMWLANDCAFQGRLREGLTEARGAQDLEPWSRTFVANVGLILYFLRDYAAARAQLDPLVEVEPEFPLARHHLARVLLMSGAPERAVSLLTGRGMADVAGGLSTLARAYVATGQRELAEVEVQRLEEKGARGIGVGFDLALIHAALGDRSRALHAIERAENDGSQMMGFLNSEPGLDLIRNDPRFRAVSRGVGLG